MASTGGARAHDPQYGCESRSGPLKLGAGKAWRWQSLALVCVRTRAAAAVDTYGRLLRNIWLRGRLVPRMEATNE